jgi:glucuronoarabinoxylan endo-1,4-beta-xylanase
MLRGTKRLGLGVGVAVLAAALLPVGAARAVLAPVTGTIDWHDVRQPIDGFGASDAFGQSAELQAFPEPLRTEILDRLFSPTTGAGLTIVRHEVPNIGGPLSASCRDAVQYATDPKCYRTDRDPGAVWFDQEARRRGATYTLGTVWSPPSWMKSNLNANGGGHVRSDAYLLYADYLVEYVKRYKAEQGVTIDGVSIANEPNAATSYPSSEWTGEEMHTFIRDYLKPRMAQDAIDFDVVIPEVSGWSDAMAGPTLADPASADAVDIVAAHGYHYVTSPSPLPLARDAGKRVWETEMSDFCECVDNTIENGLKWADIIHEFMTRAETSAWLYWWAVSVVGNGTSQQTLVNLDKANHTAIVNKRLWVLGNWSRFVRPGWERIGLRTDGFNPAARLSAYRDPASGRYAVVAVNEGTEAQDISLGLNGFTSSSVTPYRTSATEELAPLAPVKIRGDALSTTLAPRSVTTFVGTGTADTAWRLSSPDRVVLSAGHSAQVPVGLTNTAATPGGTRVVASTPAALTVAPRSQDIGAVLPGAIRRADVTVTAPTATAPATHPLVLRADPGKHAITDTTRVKIVGDTIEFSPGTAEEAEWLAEPGSSRLAGPAYDGRVRFADGTGAYAEFPIYFVYGFELPPDVIGGTISVEMANQFKVSASTDGRTFTEVLREARPIHDGSNKAFYDFDVASLAKGGKRVYLRFEDPTVADGWGVQVSRVRATLTR